MDELLKYIAQHLVDQPDAVSVKQEQSGDGLLLSLNVAQGDMGKVIGKQGKIAKAIRKVVKAAAIKKNMHCVVDIVG